MRVARDAKVEVKCVCCAVTRGGALTSLHAASFEHSETSVHEEHEDSTDEHKEVVDVDIGSVRHDDSFRLGTKTNLGF